MSIIPMLLYNGNHDEHSDHEEEGHNNKHSDEDDFSASLTKSADAALAAQRQRKEV